MISLALIGKNIAHSKSLALYEKLLNRKIKYSLLDCSSSKEIPSVEMLCSKYLGVSITSPYKRHFVGKVSIDDEAKALGVINCLGKVGHEGHRCKGTNTDYFAVDEKLDEVYQKYGRLETFLLGDGAMSQVTQRVLNRKKIKYKVFSRKLVDNFDNLNLEKLNPPAKKSKVLVINSCAREYVFKGTLPKGCVFFDYNYDFPPHQALIRSRVLEYIDGYGLLESQARYSLRFWNLAP